MKKLLVMLIAWGCICLLSTNDRVTSTQTEATVTAANDTLEILTYHQVSSQEGIKVY